MKEQPLNNHSCPRAKLGFEEEAARAFSFLKDRGFQLTEASPTLVQYERKGLVVDIFHGRQSYEIGFEINYGGHRVSLSELILISNCHDGRIYRRGAATTSQAVIKELRRVRELVLRHATKALEGNPRTFTALAQQREKWAEEFALDTQVSSLKPKAEEAFRLGKFALAAELYDRIRAGLTPVELRKADLARQRASEEG